MIKKLITLFLLSVFAFGQVTTTPNIGLSKIVPGSEIGAWGPFINSNWDLIDSYIGGTIPLPTQPFLASKSFNNVLHVGGSVVWPGSDMGAWINAAYAALPSVGGEIDVDPLPSGNCYNYSTPIVFSTPNKLPWVVFNGGSCLNFTPTSGSAITVDYSTGNPLSANHGFLNLLLQNNGCIASQGCGGSAVGLMVGNTNSGQTAAAMINVAVRGFSVAYQNTNPLSPNVQWFNPQLSADGIALLLGPLTGFILNGGTIAGNSTAIKLTSNGSIEMDIFATQFFSNIAGIIDASATVGSPGEINCHDCHLENQPSAGTHMIFGNVDIHLIGGFMEDDQLVGTTDWFINTTGNLVDINGFEIACGRTATNVVLANSPTKVYLSNFINISGARCTSLTGGSGIVYSGLQTTGSGVSTSNGTIITAGTSQAQPAISISSALTTDTAVCSLNAAPPASWQTGIQFLLPVVTGNTITPWLSNPTAGSITPVATPIRCTLIHQPGP